MATVHQGLTIIAMVASFIILVQKINHMTALILVIFILTLVCIMYLFDPAIKQIRDAENGTGGVIEEDLQLSSFGQKNQNSDRHMLSLIIPAYNEEDRLPLMLDSTLEHLISKKKDIAKACCEAIKQENQNISFEIIIINDGSTDRTVSVVKNYVDRKETGENNADHGFEHISFRLLTLKRNSGKGAAVRTGMIHSNGSLCLMVDADDATEFYDGVQKLLKEMAVMSCTEVSGKVVFGSRAHQEKESTATRSPIRTFLMHVFHFFVKILCSNQIKDTQCGFKLFSREAAILLFTNLHLQRWAFDTELVVIAERIGLPLAEVGVIWHEVDGSKLDSGKTSLAIASVNMLRDMLCVRMCYFLGIWRIKEI